MTGTETNVNLAEKLRKIANDVNSPRIFLEEFLPSAEKIASEAEMSAWQGKYNFQVNMIIASPRLHKIHDAYIMNETRRILEERIKNTGLIVDSVRVMKISTCSGVSTHILSVIDFSGK